MKHSTGHKHPAQQQPAGQPATKPRGVTSDHAGSKPSYTHLTLPGTVGRYERAAAWSKATGRSLPPHMRIRTRPVRQAEPMSVHQRFESYAGGKPGDYAHLTIERLLEAGAGTPARQRRMRHKAGTHGELPMGSRLVRGPRQKVPRTPAQLARFRKNARQQARHLARVTSGA